MAAQDVSIKLKAVDETRAAFQSVDRSLGGLKNAVFSVQTAIASIITGSTVGFVVNANKSFQTLEASLITFTGSSEKASQAFDVLSKFAATTPFGLEEVVGGFNKLIARGIAPTIAQLTSFGNIAAGTGKSLDQFIEAIADASVGEFERLKEFGIKANAEGNTVKLTFAGVTTSINRDSQSMINYLTNLGNTKFAGGMERQAETISGAFSALNDSLVLLSIEIGKSGLNNFLVENTKTLTNFVQAWNDATKASLGFFETIDLNKSIAESGAEGAIVKYTERLWQLQDALKGDKAVFKGAIQAEIDSITKKLTLLKDEMEVGTELPINPVSEQAPAIADEVKKKLEAINDEILKMTQGEQAMAVAQFARINGVTQAQTAQYKALYAQKLQIAALDRELDKASQEADANERQAFQQKVDLFNKQKQIYEETRTPIEAMANKMAELDRLLQLGVISWDEYGRAMMNTAETGFPAIKEQGKSAFEEMKEAMRNWGSDFTNVMADMVMFGKGSFSDLANSIIRDLIRIQIQKAITDPLIKAGTSYLDAVFSPSGSTGKAIGGSVQSGQQYLVGERGPEMFIPNQSGSIVPNSDMAGGGVVVNQTINVTTGVQQTVRAEIMSMMPQISNAAKAAVADAKLRGGTYGKMMA